MFWYSLYLYFSGISNKNFNRVDNAVLKNYRHNTSQPEFLSKTLILTKKNMGANLLPVKCFSTSKAKH